MNQKGFARVAVVMGVTIVAVVSFFVMRQDSNHELTNGSEEITKGVEQREGPFLVKKINPDNVEGLWYYDYPPRLIGDPRILHIGDDIGKACAGISEKLTNIDFSGQKVTFTKVVSEPPSGGCPVQRSSF